MDNTLSIRVASLTLLPVPFKVIYNIYTIHFALFTRLFLATKIKQYMTYLNVFLSKVLFHEPLNIV